MTSNSVKIAAATSGCRTSLVRRPNPGGSADQGAREGTRVPVRANGKGHRLQGWCVLTLQDVSPVTVFFSDRPQRIVGHVRNDLFLKKWAEGSNSFKSDPPNAVLSVFNEKTPPTGAVVVLSNPRLNGNNLAYDARTLKGDLPTTGIEGTSVYRWQWRILRPRL